MTTIIPVLRTAFDQHGATCKVIDDTGSWNLHELDAAAAGLAHALVEGGVQPGDRVAISGPNSRWCAAGYLAIWQAGAVPVALNHRLRGPAIRHILNDARPRSAVVEASLLPVFRTANDEAGGPVTKWFTIGQATADDDATEVSGLPAAEPMTPAGGPHDLAALLYTSGTTGRSKGVMLSHANLLWAQDAFQRNNHITAGERMLLGLPLFHCYGLIPLFLGSLVTGVDQVLQNGFPFPRTLEVLSEHKISFFPSVPPVFQAIAALPWDPARYDFSALRLVVSGAATIAEETIKRARACLGEPTFVDAYGITETSTLISVGPLDAVIPVGAAGRPVVDVDVEIRDADGQALPAGQKGEICVRSPGVMQGYYNRPDATEEVLIDSWYRTGDVGHLDANGFLFISDRIKDMIIVSGENVYPREVEAAILEHPDVARVAVVRMATTDTGEAPRAFVVAREGAELRVPDMVRFLRQRIADFKLPRKYEFVDSLPTSPSGKVLKRELQEQ